MDPSTSALASTIGRRLRQERQSRRWTLDHMATLAGVSRRMLVKVEQGEVNPSVGTLLRLSDALRIGLPDLVEPARPKAVQVTRRGHGAALWSSDAGGRGVLVGGTRSPDVMELWDWTLGGGDRHVSQPHPAGTKKLLQVHQGTITVEVEEQAVTLDAGDAVAFAGEVEHAYVNPRQTPAKFSLAVFQPRMPP